MGEAMSCLKHRFLFNKLVHLLLCPLPLSILGRYSYIIRVFQQDSVFFVAAQYVS